MSNLIQYIIQDAPEEELKKKQSQTLLSRELSSRQDTDKNYKFNSRHLLENDFSHLQSKPAPTARSYLSQALAKNVAKEGNKVSSALSTKPIGNDNASYKIAQNTKGNIANNTKANQTDYSLYGNDFSKEFIDKMTNDKEYQRALKEYAIPNEGGYVNDPQDPGGETKFGIAKRYHPNEDILNLTRERANAFLYKEIWNWNGINTLPPEIKGFVFDHGIRTSPQNAIETTHRTLGIDPVGDIIGKTTLGKLKETDYNEFLRKYKELVHEQDKKRSGYGKFGKGWDNRTEGYHISN